MKLKNLIKAEGLLVLTIVSISLFFVGKAITSPTGMVSYDEDNEIEAGMSSSEIKDILGNPYEIENIIERGVVVEYSYYMQGRDILRIGIVDGRLVSLVFR